MKKKKEDEIVGELLNRLGEICDELGWSIAILGGEEDENNVEGMIIGSDAFVQSALGAQAGGSDDDGDFSDFGAFSTSPKKTTTH